MKPKQKISFADLSYPTQAGILCGDRQFQRFAAMKSGFPGQRFTKTAAAEYLRQTCQINTRADLAHDSAAQRRFKALLTDFDQFRGRIAAPMEGTTNG